MKALDTLERGLRISPNNPEMLVLLGDIYATDQDTRQKAIEAYNKALEIRNGDSDFERVVEKKMQKMSDINTNIIN